ncbi:putative holin [Burkholderia cenocepacia]|uniref:Holin n=1 Tax=Burkholderia cenocepacia TaxID=95486 RepID=A0ABD4UPL5_9BURK|nr:putative holin [Burkholderia cenocepacia]MCW3700384.1 putative holin [Burkholderia cenocepacia]MCW3707823.1 putative holin [Burkholderia cenocepacia]MCW3716310.1 putative holin [Burkholderia cenocepacia]MCW3724619.1 putative holin [Burkholderia cenocepacia]MCW3731671.1 putative holin [Burkholderia cenocepacia]
MPFIKRFPRLTSWLVAAIILVAAIALFSPQQLPVALYKLSLVSLAAVVAYWLDRGLFPYARPDSYLERDWRHGPDGLAPEADFQVVKGYELVFAAAMLRRAVIVLGVVVGVALGL